MVATVSQELSQVCRFPRYGSSIYASCIALYEETIIDNVPFESCAGRTAADPCWPIVQAYSPSRIVYGPLHTYCTLIGPFYKC